MALLDDLKLMLDITGTDLDDKLTLIIKQSSNKLLARLPDVDDVPEDLEYIVLELAVMRFNRIGNEGMNSFSQEGESIVYEADMDAYNAEINAWLLAQADNKRGVVRFL
jgi:hypothetical protein